MLSSCCNAEIITCACEHCHERWCIECGTLIGSPCCDAAILHWPINGNTTCSKCNGLLSKGTGESDQPVARVGRADGNDYHIYKVKSDAETSNGPVVIDRDGTSTGTSQPAVEGIDEIKNARRRMQDDCDHKWVFIEFQYANRYGQRVFTRSETSCAVFICPECEMSKRVQQTL